MQHCREIERERGRKATQMLIAAHPVCVAEREKSKINFPRAARQQRNVPQRAAVTLTFFCWLPSLFHRFLLHAAARKFFLHHFGSPWKKSHWNCWPRLLALQVRLRWEWEWEGGGGVMRVRATPSYCSGAVHFIIILRAIKMKCQTKWQQFWLNFFVYDSVDKK